MRGVLWGIVWALMAVGGWACEDDADGGPVADLGVDMHVEDCEGAGGSLHEGTSGRCCPGLSNVAALVFDGECYLQDGDFAICILCGDGLCGYEENGCNCPEDCTECIPEGTSWHEDDDPGLVCCGDSTPLTNSRRTEDGRCSPDEVYTCGRCGDGVCQAPAENDCNCWQDCPAESP